MHTSLTNSNAHRPTSLRSANLRPDLRQLCQLSSVWLHKPHGSKTRTRRRRQQRRKQGQQNQTQASTAEKAKTAEKPSTATITFNGEPDPGIKRSNENRQNINSLSQRRTRHRRQPKQRKPKRKQRHQAGCSVLFSAPENFWITIMSDQEEGKETSCPHETIHRVNDLKTAMKSALNAEPSLDGV